jgi:hypothetical protein
MPTWPSYARIEVTGFEESPQQPVRSTKMEDGFIKHRERNARVSIRRRLNARMSHADYQSWRTWWRDTIAHGAKKFDWPDPLDDNQVKTAQIVDGKFTARSESGGLGRPPVRVVELELRVWDA